MRELSTFTGKSKQREKIILQSYLAVYAENSIIKRSFSDNHLLDSGLQDRFEKMASRHVIENGSKC